MGYSVYFKTGFAISVPKLNQDGYFGCIKHGIKTGIYCDECGLKNQIRLSDDGEDFLEELVEEFEIEDYSICKNRDDSQIVLVIENEEIDCNFTDSNHQYFLVPDIRYERGKFMGKHHEILQKIEKKFGATEINYVTGLYESC